MKRERRQPTRRELESVTSWRPAVRRIKLSSFTDRPTRQRDDTATDNERS